MYFDITQLQVKLQILYSNVKYENLKHIYDLIIIFECDAKKYVISELYKH